MSPEDLFNMFFGGGGGMRAASFGNGPFGGGPIFSASFGGPGGFRTARMRTNTQQEARDAEPRSMLAQLLPIIILFAFALLNVLPTLFGSASTPDPHFSFTSNARYNVERNTGSLGVKYHVNGAEFSGHPIAAELARNENRPGPELRKFEKTVEQVYTQDLYTQCQRGLDRKASRRDAEIGVFGIGTDWGKVKRIEEERVESCERLREMGLLK